MKKLGFTGLLILFPALALLAQKKVISQNDLFENNVWHKIEQMQISHDGKFIVYELHPGLIIQATDKEFRREFPGYSVAFNGNSFSPDGRFFITRGNNNLGIYEFEKDKFEEISNVENFRIEGSEKNPWLFYLHGGDVKKLIIKNLRTGMEKTYSSVEEYFITDEAEKFVFIEKSNERQELHLVTLPDFSKQNIATTSGKFSQLKFDHAKKILAAFETVNKDGKEEHKLLVYQLSSKNALSVDNYHAGIGKDFSITTDQVKFTFDGRILLLKLEPIIEEKIKKKDIPNLDVWHFRDYNVQSTQLKGDVKDRYTASLDLENGKVIILDSVINSDDIKICETAKTHIGFISERFPDRLALKKTYLYTINLLTGKRTKIYGGSEDSHCVVSPNGKYAFYFPKLLGKGYVYEIETGINRIVTDKIPYSLGNKHWEWPMLGDPLIGIAGWLDEGNSILLYDEFDIWKVDLRGQKAPICITKGYGRTHQTVLRLTSNGKLLLSFWDVLLLSNKSPLVLVGQNIKTKDQGFYTFDLQGEIIPQQLLSGPYEYVRLSSQPWISVGFDNHMRGPLKAKNANVHVYFASNVKEGLQLYITRDNFNTAKQLTNVGPHKDFNWMTSELVTWRMFDGKESQGIFYKPENFDSSKKYPVIFIFYEKNSDALHSYFMPGEGGGALVSSIPYLVSNGYLVFVPDIHYNLGHVSESAYNAVCSAAKYFASKPWVDIKRMGISGHSFGGYETMCILSRSGNMFAAAFAAAGLSDQVSLFHFNPQIIIGSQTRIGAFPWERPDLYIENSPLFFADKFQTPLLMMNNDGDGAVPWTQGVEMYIALRQLNKPSWLLNYNGAGHQGGGNDYMKRVMQFFDHYLKDAPPPKWMTEGIAAKLKGVEDGLELDLSGKNPI